MQNIKIVSLVAKTGLNRVFLHEDTGPEFLALHLKAAILDRLYKISR